MSSGMNQSVAVVAAAVAAGAMIPVIGRLSAEICSLIAVGRVSSQNLFAERDRL